MTPTVNFRQLPLEPARTADGAPRERLEGHPVEQLFSPVGRHEGREGFPKRRGVERTVNADLRDKTKSVRAFQNFDI